MTSAKDDVRLPFSVLDPVVGDVFSVLWEPEMLGETGSTLKILTSEVLSQVGQSVLQATVMATLMSALQWPIRMYLKDSITFFGINLTNFSSAHEAWLSHRQSMVQRIGSRQGSWCSVGRRFNPSPSWCAAHHTYRLLSGFSRDLLLSS